MTRNGRWGCLWALVGCVFGGVWGLVAAILIGWINAPVVNPNDELAHEWYTPFVLLMVMPAGVIIGAVIGSLAVNAFKVTRGKAIAWGGAGWLLALAIGSLVFAGRGEPGFLFLHGLMTCAFIVVGFNIAENRAGRTQRRTHEVRE